MSDLQVKIIYRTLHRMESLSKLTRHWIFFFHGDLFNVSLMGMSALWVSSTRPLTHLLRFVIMPWWSMWMIEPERRFSGFRWRSKNECRLLSPDCPLRFDVCIGAEWCFDNTPETSRYCQIEYFGIARTLRRLFQVPIVQLLARETDHRWFDI